MAECPDINQKAFAKKSIVIVAEFANLRAKTKRE